MTLALQFAASQILGARTHQEDDYRFLDLYGDDGLAGGGLLMVLADGMGGHAAGATAAALSVQAFVDTFAGSKGDATQRLEEGLAKSNDAIAGHLIGAPEHDGMGCTLVGLVLSAGGVEWISVGDSPAWRLRNGHLDRLNADHSMAPVIDRQVQRGELTARLAAMHPHRNALRSAIMGEEISLIDRSAAPLAVAPGDRLIVASDGLQTIDEQEIVEIGAGAGAQMIAEQLVAGVENRDAPRQDNTTVLVALVE